MNIRHFWHGCAKFNLLYPHWEKTDQDYPRCKICGHSGHWIWGYKNKEPDIIAQRLQGRPINKSAEYWSKEDGYRI